ncbi:hypothetical protein KAM380_020480 [Aeromonas caviae]|nr:hypothetical protein KAM380_020480 [Aeromonas caviae]
MQPIATQGRSHIDRRMQDLCGSGLVSRKEGKALPCGLQPFFTLNQAAYNAGKNSRVSTVATINPPMIATAIGP